MCALGLEKPYSCGPNIDKSLKYWTAEDFSERGLLLFLPHLDHARTVGDFVADRVAAQ